MIFLKYFKCADFRNSKIYKFRNMHFSKIRHQTFSSEKKPSFQEKIVPGRTKKFHKRTEKKNYFLLWIPLPIFVHFRLEVLTNTLLGWNLRKSPMYGHFYVQFDSSWTSILQTLLNGLACREKTVSLSSGPLILELRRKCCLHWC